MKPQQPRLPRVLAVILASVLMLGVGSLIVSCGRSPLGKADGPASDAASDGSDDGGDDGRPDVPWVFPDGPRRDNLPPDWTIPPDVDRDKFIWPDAPPKEDAWPKNDIYPGGGGTPFGCFTDADCFHLRCCATPWGVKVCMEHCP
jgi:hypothetical protein